MCQAHDTCVEYKKYIVQGQQLTEANMLLTHWPASCSSYDDSCP